MVSSWRHFELKKLRVVSWALEDLPSTEICVVHFPCRHAWPNRYLRRVYAEPGEKHVDRSRPRHQGYDSVALLLSCKAEPAHFVQGCSRAGFAIGSGEKKKHMMYLCFPIAQLSDEQLFGDRFAM